MFMLSLLSNPLRLNPFISKDKMAPSTKKVQSKLYPLFFQPASALANNRNDKDDNSHQVKACDDDLDISLSELGKRYERNKDRGKKMNRSIGSNMKGEKRASLKQLPREAFRCNDGANSVNKNGKENMQSMRSNASNTKKRRIEPRDQISHGNTNVVQNTEQMKQEGSEQQVDEIRDSGKKSQTVNEPIPQHQSATTIRCDSNNHSNSVITELDPGESVKRNEKRCRHWSSASMDFQPTTPNAETQAARKYPSCSRENDKNLLHQLYYRSIYGSDGPVLRQVPQRQWRSPSWLNLEQSPSSSNRNSTIEHLAWDKMGVLLATASSDRTISIYDWDMVRSAHRQSLNEKQRYKAEKKLRQLQVKEDDLTAELPKGKRSQTSMPPNRSQFSIPPILTFSVPHAVTSLSWNPHNLDQLAVGFQFMGSVRLYHVDLVADWAANRNENRNRLHNSWSVAGTGEDRNVPPSSTYTVLSDPRTARGGSASSTVFPDEGTILVCFGKVGVYCWDIKQCHLRWRFQASKSTVRCMALCGPEWVLLGTENGTLILLNWTKSIERRQRAALSSRSEVPQPQFLHEYVTKFDSEQLEKKEAPERQLAIEKLHVENLCAAWNQRITSHRDNPRKCGVEVDAQPRGKLWNGRCRVTWVTPCGWLLSIEIDLPPVNRNTMTLCKVCHAPSKVVVQNADGTIIDPSSSRRPSGDTNQRNNYLWSLPVKPIAADYCHDSSGSATKSGSDCVLCWTNVPAVTKILPHHDKYVVTSQPRIVRKQEVLLLWKDLRTNHDLNYDADGSRDNAAQFHTIPLPKLWTTPSVIAVHPCREWIVVGGMEHQWLGVLSSRE